MIGRSFAQYGRLTALEQAKEFFSGQTRMANYCAESPTIQNLVIRNHNKGERLITAENDVATFLAPNFETDFL